jgi:hypothetical protein
MTTPYFNDLTPPAAERRAWVNESPMFESPPAHFPTGSPLQRAGTDWAQVICKAARWGARHGYEQARQLWPEPITDRPPTEADGDSFEDVQILTSAGRWKTAHWSSAQTNPWLHTPRWQPLQPSLQDQALAKVGAVLNDRNKVFLDDVHEALELARRALEQAGEGAK